jgi:predicted glutamine amidotransferase
MCGIIGAMNFGKNEEPVNQWVIDRLEDQLERGKEGFGVVFVKKDGAYEITRATELTLPLIDLRMKQSSAIFMHHRKPTSSANKVSQTHPILVDNGSLKHKYLVMHNGVVRNDEGLKKIHEKDLGFTYTTWHKRKWYQREEWEFNDTEAFAIELARFIEGQSPMLMTEGTAAFIALQIDKEKDKVIRVYFGRKDDNPLNLAVGTGMIRLSSEGEGNEIKPFKLYHFNLDKPSEIHKQKLTFKPEIMVGRDDAAKGWNSSRPPICVNGFEADNAYKFNDWVGHAVEDNEARAVELVQELFCAIKDDDVYALSNVNDLIKETVKEIRSEFKQAVKNAQEVRLEEDEKETRSLLSNDQIYDVGKYQSK